MDVSALAAASLTKQKALTAEPGIGDATEAARQTLRVIQQHLSDGVKAGQDHDDSYAFGCIMRTAETADGSYCIGALSDLQHTTPIAARFLGLYAKWYASTPQLLQAQHFLTQRIDGVMTKHFADNGWGNFPCGLIDPADPTGG